MRKDHRPTSPLNNAGPRQLRPSTAAAANSTPAEAFQEPSKTSQELLDRLWKAQKRKYAAEDEHSQKRPRKNPPYAPALPSASQDFISELSEDNLKKLQRDLQKLRRGIPDEMDSGGPNRVHKRASSRQASLSDLNQDTASLDSRKTSVSNSFYRYRILHQARIYVRPEPPPKDIQAQMDVTFKHKIPERRRREISGIAKKTSQKFIDKLRGAHREDDLVELVHEALRMMHNDETFDFSRKAGIVSALPRTYTSLRANVDLDWDPSLKPAVPQALWDLDALAQPNNEAVEVVDRPNKRHQGERHLPSPDTTQLTMQSPTAPSQSKQDAVKRPRPDFTIGLHQSMISSALMKRGLSKGKAEDFLEVLQRERKLCSDPTQNFLNVRFPMLVIEGKAYATGKAVFEAQNQAAVSGACMVNLRQQLIDLFEGVFPTPGGRKTPLAFSICTEGPHIEFWVHYALSEDSVRSHYMNIFRTCHASLQAGLEDFLMDVERLMRWTKDEFLKEVADQLCRLATHAARA